MAAACIDDCSQDGERAEDGIEQNTIGGKHGSERVKPSTNDIVERHYSLAIRGKERGI